MPVSSILRGSDARRQIPPQYITGLDLKNLRTKLKAANRFFYEAGVLSIDGMP